MRSATLKIETKKDPSGKAYFFLSGDIDETADFSGIPQPSILPVIDIDLAEVRRINSTGVKAWMAYFTHFQKTKTRLRFYRVPAPIVEQLNQISNFSCGGTVESLALPFQCSSCQHAGELFFKISDLKLSELSNSKAPCPKCQEKSYQFDEIPELYFNFLE